MNNRTKIWLATAAFLVITGLLIFIIAFSVCGFDFSRLGTVKYESNTHLISDKFDSISVKTDTADIIFLPSENGNCMVECYEAENQKHSVAVIDGTLKINVTDERKWYEYIEIGFESSKITVYLPDEEYASLNIKESTGDIEITDYFKFDSIDIKVSTGDVKNYASASDLIKIKTSTGDIMLENITAGALDLSGSTGMISVKSVECDWNIEIRVSTGETVLSDVSCMNLISGGSTGDISLFNVIADGLFSIERSTGDIKFESSDATEIFIKTDTGDVRGSLLSDKVFFAESDTGRINIPKTLTGGKCEITTDTGDIKITIN